MFKKILFPTDGSENSKRALNYALEIAKKFNSEVVILHTYEFISLFYGHPSAAIGVNHYSNEIRKDLIEYGEKILTATKNIFEAENIKIEVLHENGDAGSLIVKALKDKECDVVVIGSRGMGSVESFLLGSVSNYVIHHTNKPVLLID